MRAYGFRLDFEGVTAVAADGSWKTIQTDPYTDLEGAFHPFRKHEVEERRFPSVELGDSLRPVKHGESVNKLLWGGSLSVLIYRLGETQMVQAEVQVAAALEDDDFSVRRAAAWVLSRYWRE